MFNLARKSAFVNDFFDSFDDFFVKTDYAEVKDGKFTYKTRIPENADLSAITASITDGILEISVPLRKPESRKVEIKVT